jgi:hypothetical protein
MGRTYHSLVELPDLLVGSVCAGWVGGCHTRVSDNTTPRMHTSPDSPEQTIYDTVSHMRKSGSNLHSSGLGGWSADLPIDFATSLATGMAADSTL